MFLKISQKFTGKHLWQSLFFNKVAGLRKLVAGIKLVEGDKLLHEDTEVAKELNNFFKEAASTLDVNENSYIINPGSIYFSSSIEKTISKYKLHPSILLINDKIVNQGKFYFKPISKLDIEKEVQLINPKKASTSDSIPPKILKITSEVSTDTLQELVKDMLKSGNFPDNLKLADITPVFRKKNLLHK